MGKLFGAKNVAVLNGGYVKWQKENLPIENAPYEEISQRDKPSSEEFDYALDTKRVRDMNSTLDLSIEIMENKTKEQLIDARPHLRYLGQGKEPRPCRITGHIPGAKSVFFKDLVDENLCLKSTEELKKEFEKQEVRLDNDITVYCGSGV